MPPPKRKAVSRSVSPEDPVEMTSKEGLQWVYNGFIMGVLWSYIGIEWISGFIMDYS